MTPSWRWPLLVALAAALFCVALSRVHLAGDAMLYIASGRFVREHGLPDVDVFSDLSVRTPWRLHMLLPMVGFAWVFDDGGGGPTLLVLTAVCGAAVLWLWCRQLVDHPLALVAFLGALPLLLAADREFFEVRGQLFAYLPLLAWIALVRRALAGRLPLAHTLAGVLVVALWANTHPSFVFAPLLVVLAAVGVMGERSLVRAQSTLRALGGLFIAACGGALLSPYGAGLTVDVLRLVADPTTARIDHMRSPPLDGARGLLWCAVVVSLLAVAALRTRRGPRRHRRVDVLVLLALVGMTLVSRRYLAFAVAWCVPLLPAVIGHPAAPLTRDEPLRRRLRLALVVVSVVVVVAQASPPRPIDATFPTEASVVLGQRPQRGRLLNEFGWGGFLMAELGPRRPVFIDGRNNLYSNGVFDDYLRLTFVDDGIDELLERYQVGSVLWTRGWPLDLALARRPSTWSLVYADEKAVLYERR
jgi:hypothetical protein